MNNFRDRRSTGGNGKAVEPEAQGDPKPHRLAPGVRSDAQFFKNLDRPMTRGDYLKVHAMHEYHRRETRWWRRLYRYVRGWPQVVDLNANLAAAHAVQLDRIRQQLEAQTDA